MRAVEKFKVARAGIADAMTAAQGAVAELRASIAEMEDQIAETESRPPSKSGVLQAAERDVARCADMGRTLISRASQRALLGEGVAIFRFAEEAADVRAILAAVAGPALLTAFMEQVEQHWGDDAGLTDEERATELIRLHGEKFSLELFEERIIREAERAGIPIDRREDAHPAALLARDEDLPQ